MQNSCVGMPALAGASAQGAGVLPVYLNQLLDNHYMFSTVMDRQRDLGAWLAFAPDGGDESRLVAFLDELADAEGRRRCFVAVRSFVRWLAVQGHIRRDWSALVNVQRVIDGSKGE